jgi:hypothetical protein
MKDLRYYIDLLNEAKPENIGQNKLDQLFSTYQKRDINDQTLQQKYTSGMDIANLLYQYSGPKNFLWVINQYIKDQHFFLHDLPQWKITLDEFDKITRSKTQLNKDITSYKNIDELRKAISSLKNQDLTANFYPNAINKIDEYTKKGEARWLHRSNDYSIYQPLTFKSSNICESFNLPGLNICSILSKNLYNMYSQSGTLIYIIDQRKIFICFVSRDTSMKRSEFVDEQNVTDYNLGWQLKKFPALKNILKDVDTNDLNVKLRVEPDKRKVYKIAIDGIKQSTISLDMIPEELRDREMYLTAVNQNGEALRFVPEELRDREMCLTAVTQNGLALGIVPEELRDRKMCLTAVTQNSRALGLVPEELRDREMCLTAVKSKSSVAGINTLKYKLGSTLRHVPEELRDYEICLAAVKQQDYKSLRYVPKDLPQYPEIALAAVNKNSKALEYVPKDLPQYPEIALAAVQKDGDALEHVPTELSEYREIALAAVKQNGWALVYVPEELRDYKMCLAAVKQNPLALYIVPDNLKSEIEKALANEKNKTDESINRLKRMAGITS